RREGIELSRAASGVVAEEEPDDEGDREGDDQGGRTAQCLPPGEPADRPRDAGPGQNAGHAPERAQDERLGQELRLNLPRARSDRLADTDLAYSLVYGHEHHVHDPDPTDEQRDPAQREGEDGEGSSATLLSL